MSQKTVGKVRKINIFHPDDTPMYDHSAKNHRGNLSTKLPDEVQGTINRKTSESSCTSFAVLADLDNVGIAFGISLLSCIQAEI